MSTYASRPFQRILTTRRSFEDDGIDRCTTTTAAAGDSSGGTIIGDTMAAGGCSGLYPPHNNHYSTVIDHHLQLTGCDAAQRPNRMTDIIADQGVRRAGRRRDLQYHHPAALFNCVVAAQWYRLALYHRNFKPPTTRCRDAEPVGHSVGVVRCTVSQ